MYKRRIFQFLIAFILMLTLACGLIPSATTPISPSPTAPLEFPDPFPSDAPTPLSTDMPPSFESSFIGAQITDTDGRAIIQNTSPAVNLSIEVKDNSSSASLERIQVQAFLVDHNSKILVVALDPSDEYLPLVKVVDNPLSLKDGPAKVLGVSSVNAQGGPIELALLMVTIVGLESLGKSAYQYFRDMPEIREFSFWQATLCFTGSQMASNFAVITGIIPMSTKGTALYDPILESLIKISTHTAGQDAESYLRSLPDRYLIRFHRFPVPNFSNSNELGLSLIGIEILGKCNPPTPIPTLTPPLVNITITVPGNVVWYDTKIKITKGQDLTFLATGTISTLPGSEGSTSGPNGAGYICPYGDNKPDCLMNGAPYGKLVGKIGNGIAFSIGAHLSMTAPSSGNLYLAINDDEPYFEDNSGSYQVAITIK